MLGSLWWGSCGTYLSRKSVSLSDLSEQTKHTVSDKTNLVLSDSPLHIIFCSRNLSERFCQWHITESNSPWQIVPVEASIYLPSMGFLPGWYCTCHGGYLPRQWPSFQNSTKCRLWIDLVLVCRSPRCPQIPFSLQTLCVAVRKRLDT